MTAQRAVWQEPQFPSIRVRPGPGGRICDRPVPCPEPVGVADAVVVEVDATVGTLVGAVVGATVGAVVGATVGTFVGTTVGTAVGATVGAIVGTFAGATVGAAVGAALGGTAVGTAVGVGGAEQAVVNISIAMTKSMIKHDEIRCISHIS
jgi:hypothetical protein